MMKHNRTKGVILLALSAALTLYGSVNMRDRRNADEGIALEVSGYESYGIRNAYILNDEEGNVTGYKVEVEQYGYSKTAPVVMAVTFSADINTITDIEIVSHNETPSIGAKIENERFLEQFIGMELPVILDCDAKLLSADESEMKDSEASEETEDGNIQGAVNDDGKAELVVEDSQQENNIINTDSGSEGKLSDITENPDAGNNIIQSAEEQESIVLSGTSDGQDAAVAEDRVTVKRDYLDGTYTKKSQYPDYGFYDTVTVTVADGTITEVIWDSVTVSGISKRSLSETENYGVNENGLTWAEQADIIQKIIVDRQDIADNIINEDGTVNGITGVTINISGFVRLVSICLDDSAYAYENAYKDGIYEEIDLFFNESAADGNLPQEIQDGSDENNEMSDEDFPEQTEDGTKSVTKEDKPEDVSKLEGLGKEAESEPESIEAENSKPEDSHIKEGNGEEPAETEKNDFSSLTANMDGLKVLFEVENGVVTNIIFDMTSGDTTLRKMYEKAVSADSDKGKSEEITGESVTEEVKDTSGETATKEVKDTFAETATKEVKDTFAETATKEVKDTSAETATKEVKDTSAETAATGTDNNIETEPLTTGTENINTGQEDITEEPEVMPEDDMSEDDMSEDDMSEDDMTVLMSEWISQADYICREMIRYQGTDIFTRKLENGEYSQYTINIDGFEELTDKCRERARKAYRAKPEYELINGSYELVSQEKVNGWYPRIRLIVSDKKIESIKCDFTDAERESLESFFAEKESQAYNPQISEDEYGFPVIEGSNINEEEDLLNLTVAEYTMLLNELSVLERSVEELQKVLPFSEINGLNADYAKIDETFLEMAGEVLYMARKPDIVLTDGVYTEKSDTADSGYYSQVVMTVKDGVITDIVWDSVDKSGEGKRLLSLTGRYVMTDDGLLWAEQADALAEYVIENQDINSLTLNADGSTDAVTGVSISVSSFVNQVKSCIERAQNVAGAVPDITFKDGEYVSETENSTDGFKDIVKLKVENGRITDVSWDGTDTEGRFRSELSMTGEYVTKSNTAPWYQQAAVLETYVLEHQGIENLVNGNGKVTDNLVIVDIDVSGFVEGINDCLKQAGVTVTEQPEEPPSVTTGPDAATPEGTLKPEQNVADAVSGATISSRAVTAGINAAHEYLKNVMNK